MSKTFYSLRLFNFRLMFLSTLFSASGMWMQFLAQDWLVLTQLTDNDATQVGFITAMQFLPQLFFAPWAGVVADRVNRRRLLQICQIGGGVLAATLGFLVISGDIRLWHVYVAAFVLGSVSSFEGPTRMSFVSEVVPESSLPNAVGLNAMAFHTARLLGPAAAGFVIDAAGTGWVFVLTGILYAVPAFALAFIRVSELIQRQRLQKKRGQIREGLTYIHRRAEIQIVLLVIAVVAGLGLNLQMTSAFMATQIYHKEASELGLFSTFIALGAVIGSLIAARRRVPRLRTVIVAAGAFGVAETLLALAPSFVTFMLLAIPVGFLSLTVLTSANVYVQLAAEEHIRGRVLALYGMIFLGVSPICAPFVGWVAQVMGARWSILVGSLSCIAVSVVATAWAYKMRQAQGVKPSIF